MNQNENLKMYTDNTSKYFPKYIYYKQHFFPEIYFTLFNHWNSYFEVEGVKWNSNNTQIFRLN